MLHKHPQPLARRYFPILNWGAKYAGKAFANDLMFVATVTIMLIPQSPACARPEGRAAQVGMLSILYGG